MKKSKGSKLLKKGGKYGSKQYDLAAYSKKSHKRGRKRG
jgi:hypothetical protein